jgi:DNA sulfur modification protein DndD
MAFNIKILEWEAKGFRCPDHKINLRTSEDSVYSVSLIQMPNGTGKTTTLNLIQAALSGGAKSWLREEVLEFKKRGSKLDSAEFKMTLLLNNKLMTIIMYFDFENAKVSYKTTYGSGQKDEFKPPRGFDKFLNENFVKFYVFDGELAEKLLDKNHANAESVIKNLYQINMVDTLKSAIDKHWERQTEELKSTEEKGLSRSKNRLKDKKEQLEKYENDQRILLKEKKGIEKNLEEKENKFKQEIDKSDKYRKQFDGYQVELSQLLQQKNKYLSSVLESMTNPYSLSVSIVDELHHFKNSLDRVKLPETAAKEFFQELAEETECVCGREIDNSIRDEILKRASYYLGSDDVSLLNSIKTTIEDNIGESREESRDELDDLLYKLNNVLTSITDVELDIETLKNDFEEDNPDIENIKDEISELKEQLANVNNDLEKYIDTLHEKFNIEKLKKEIDELEEEVARRTNTVELNNKRKKLKEILTDAHKKAKIKISSEITDETNSKIVQLMPDNHIRIEKIEKHIVLQNQSGGSVGEQLSVAYAFLSTLFQRADEHSLPFVMDSPVGPVDLKIRPEIGNLIPKLADQFLAFTISSERAGFLSSLKKSTNGEIQYLTLFRNSIASYNDNGLYDSIVKTDDGILIEDENFFNNFQIEDED